MLSGAIYLPANNLKLWLLLCIRNKGFLELIKIAITYLNNNIISYSGKKSFAGFRPNLELI